MNLIILIDRIEIQKSCNKHCYNNNKKGTGFNIKTAGSGGPQIQDHRQVSSD